MIELSSLVNEARERCGSPQLEGLCGRVVPVDELELVYGLVRARRPLLVLETETGSGLMAAAIACALEKNNRGVLWSFACNADKGAATDLWSSLGVRSRIQLHADPFAEFLDKYNGPAFDFVVADGAKSHVELARVLERRLLDGLLVVRGGGPEDSWHLPTPRVTLSPTTRVAHVNRARGREAPRGPISIDLLSHLTPEQVDASVDFSRLQAPAREFLPSGHVGYLNDPPGREHYKLLAFLSNLVEGESVMDVGTLHGSSALALSCGSKRVVSFDIARIHQFPDRWDSIEFVQGDVLGPGSARERFTEALPETRLILLDVDPHDGEQEAQFLALLEEVGFRGCLVLDDIHLNHDMRRLWSSIDRPKVDLTACGHTTGTGCVLFEGERREVT